jgi:protein SCO1/2
LLFAASLAGCHRPVAQSPRAAPPPATKDYRVTGIVRAVNPGARIVTIRHDAIPGYMGAMTMPFSVSKPELLDDVRPGDEVEGTLRVSDRDSELTDLVVSRPAPAPPLSLNLTEGTAQLHAAPRLLDLGEAVPDFTMTTQDGRELKLSDLRGKVVVLTFIYTRCPLPDFCPLMDRKFAELAGRLEAFPDRADAVRLLSLSFDPEHDSPDVLRKHAQVQGAKPPLWSFAVASHSELAKVAAGLGLTYGPSKDEVIHNLVTVVIDPSGKLAGRESGTEAKTWKPAELLKVIYRLMLKETP